MRSNLLLQTCTIDVELVLEIMEEDTLETELVKNIEVEETINHDIILSSVTTQLEFSSYFISNSHLWFYAKDFNDYVYCGIDPIEKSICVDKKNLFDNTLKLRIGIQKENYYKALAKSRSLHSKKVKDRKLIDIIPSVKKWRELSKISYKNDGVPIKIGFEKAASILGYSKKTLDDYYQKIKAGYKHGFDFSKNSKMDMGYLAKFIEKHENGLPGN